MACSAVSPAICSSLALWAARSASASFWASSSISVDALLALVEVLRPVLGVLLALLGRPDLPVERLLLGDEPLLEVGELVSPAGDLLVDGLAGLEELLLGVELRLLGRGLGAAHLRLGLELRRLQDLLRLEVGEGARLLGVPLRLRREDEENARRHEKDRGDGDVNDWIHLWSPSSRISSRVTLCRETGARDRGKSCR